MGGMVTSVVRYKDGETISFKSSTGFFDSKFNTPYLLEENWLKEKIKEYNCLIDSNLPDSNTTIYENTKAVKAPYHYGINLIDYQTNTIISINDFNSILNTGTLSILNDYKRLFKQNFIIRFKKGESIEKNNILKKSFLGFYSLHVISYAIENNVPILKDNKVIEHKGTLESLIESLYNVNLEGLNNEEKEIKLNEVDRYENLHNGWEGYSNIDFKFPNWKIMSWGSENITDLHDHMIENGFVFSEYEKQLWNDFIKEIENREVESEDEE